MFQHVQTQTALATCPDCKQRIRLRGDIFVGRKVTCLNCDTQLVVYELTPVKLDRGYEEWDIDDDDWW